MGGITTRNIGEFVALMSQIDEEGNLRYSNDVLVVHGPHDLVWPEGERIEVETRCDCQPCQAQRKRLTDLKQRERTIAEDLV